jgi:IclR family transcriptional regulator, KDG regulon repressor
MLNAIDKVFYILDQFTNEKPQWGVRELSTRTGLTPNLTHWYLKNLERNRVVRKDAESDKYELSYRIFELGNRNSRHRLLKVVAQPILSELSRSTKGTAVLRVLEANELICVAAAESSYSLRVNYAEGAREPCNFGCIGKLLMAYLNEADAERLIREGHGKRFTPKTVLDLHTLKKEWARIRARGWVYSSGEALDGVKAIGAPVRDSSGEVCAGIGVTFPAILLPKSRVQMVVAAVVKAAVTLSLKLGHQETKLGMISKPVGRRIKRPSA